MHAILHEEPRLREPVRAQLPPELFRILTRALDRLPKNRYKTVAELAAELKAFKRELEQGQAATTLTKTKLVLRRVSTLPRSRGIDYEKELNEAQYRAVTTTEGPLLIVAGAGTGKTRTLVYRVARLIETGVRPESVLLLTFTRRAADGMLATVHSAKGLEWDALFVIWMTDGWFPSLRSYDEFEDLEEERRLLYVATTRARRHLYFVYPLAAQRGADGDTPPAVSRFLEPIPDTILPRASLSGGEGAGLSASRFGDRPSVLNDLHLFFAFCLAGGAGNLRLHLPPVGISPWTGGCGKYWTTT